LAYCNDRNAYKADLAAWSRLGEKEISAIVQSPDLMGKTIYEVACEFKDYPIFATFVAGGNNRHKDLQCLIYVSALEVLKKKASVSRTEDESRNRRPGTEGPPKTNRRIAGPAPKT
jgi:hypothetical protein